MWIQECGSGEWWSINSDRRVPKKTQHWVSFLERGYSPPPFLVLIVGCPLKLNYSTLFFSLSPLSPSCSFSQLLIFLTTNLECCKEDSLELTSCLRALLGRMSLLCEDGEPDHKALVQRSKQGEVFLLYFRFFNILMSRQKNKEEDTKVTGVWPRGGESPFKWIWPLQYFKILLVGGWSKFYVPKFNGGQVQSEAM